MYVRERRKLRYVMAKMEETYGFKATYDAPLTRLPGGEFYAMELDSAGQFLPCNGALIN